MLPMRSLCFRLATMALLGLGGLCLGQQHGDPFATPQQDFEPDPGPPRMVSVQAEFIEVSHEQLLDLLFAGEAPTADATPLRKKLQGMIQAGQAKLLETTLVSARSGIKASTGSHHEWIYPTEFEPWEVPQEIDPPGKPQRLTAEDRRGLEAVVAPMTPTSFETRELGASLEVTPHAGEHNVYLEFSSSLDWPTGRTVVVERKDSTGNPVRAELPGIYSMQLTTRLSCPPGRPVLAGVLSPMDTRGATDPSRKVMVFVKCGVAGARPGPLGDVLVSVHVAEMPHDLAAELASGDVDGDALFKKSREFVKAGRAKLFETSVLRVPSGEKGEVNSVQEHIFPTENGPSCTLFGGDPATAPPPPPPPQIRFPHVPTSFEVRNVGNSFEVEPTAGEKLLDVRAAWEFELHPGDSVLEDWTDSLGNRYQRKMPAFVSFKTSFGSTLVTGKWRLAAVQNSSDAAGKIDPSRKLVVFLRADHLQAGAGK
jgi:hypothetical protein